MTRRSDSFWLVLMVFAAAALRFNGLGLRSLWLDEAYAVALASLPWKAFAGAMLETTNHVPLYFSAMRLVASLGHNEFWLRLPSAWCGVLAVPLFYQLGRVSFDRRTGLFAALLVAINPFSLWYAQEAKMYSMMAALSAGIGYFFLRCIEGRELKSWIGLVVMSSLAYSTHYFGFLLPIAQLVFFLQYLDRYRLQFRRWVLAQVVACLPLVPWFYLLFRQENQALGIGWIPQPGLLSPLLTLQAFGTGYGSQFTILTLAGLAVMLSALLLGIFSPQAGTRQSRLFLGVWLVVPFIVVLAISIQRAFYDRRYFIIVLPAFSVLMAAGASGLRNKAARASLSVALVLVPLLSFLFYPDMGTFPQEDWRGAAGHVQARAEPGDAVVLQDFDTMIAFRHYYVGNVEEIVREIGAGKDRLKGLPVSGRRLWIVERPSPDPGLDSWLEANRPQVVDTRHFAGIDVIQVDFSERSRSE